MRATPSIRFLMRVFNLLAMLLFGFELSMVCVPLLNWCELALAAETRASSSGKPVQTVRPIPQPNLDAVEKSVREQIEDAWAELQGATQRVGNDQGQLGDVYGQMGKVYHAYDFFDAAETCYQNAMNLAPGNSSWPYALGRLYQERGDIRKSIEQLNHADSLGPNAIPVLVRLAEAYLAD